VQPIFGQRFLSCEPFGLCDFGFVVGKDEVAASAVEIVRGSEVGECYRRVFNVPAGSSLAPGAVPRDLSWLLGFPDDKVGGVAFVRVGVYSVDC